MSENTKYYWFKLKDNFFNQLPIKKIRSMPGGDTYVIIYQQMILMSLKTEGVIEYQKIDDSLLNEISITLDIDIETLKIACAIFEKLGLVESIQNENAFFLPAAIENTGSENKATERVRRFREKQRLLKQDVTLPALQCNALETKCNTEREKEINREIEREKEQETPSFQKEFSEKENANHFFSKPNSAFETSEKEKFEKAILHAYEILTARTCSDFTLLENLRSDKNRLELYDAFKKRKYNAIEAVHFACERAKKQSGAKWLNFFSNLFVLLRDGTADRKVYISRYISEKEYAEIEKQKQIKFAKEEVMREEERKAKLEVEAKAKKIGMSVKEYLIYEAKKETDELELPPDIRERLERLIAVNG